MMFGFSFASPELAKETTTRSDNKRMN